MTIYETPIAPTQDELDAVEMCPCEEPDVHDRTCHTCGRLNLAALMAWRFCDCQLPDLWIHGLRARNCQRCGNPVHSLFYS